MDVVLNSRKLDLEHRSDLAVREAVIDELNDLGFSSGQPNTVDLRVPAPDQGFDTAYQRRNEPLRKAGFVSRDRANYILHLLWGGVRLKEPKDTSLRISHRLGVRPVCDGNRSNIRQVASNPMSDEKILCGPGV